MRNLMLVLFGGACLCGWGEIPKQVDLLVIGGSVDAVQAAIDAKRNGENVFLVTAYPYLGEDMAATLELGFGQMCPSDPLLFSMWKASSDIAPFDYWPDHRSQGKRWVYHNDPYDRLSEPGRPPSPADAVLYTDDVSYKCILRKPSNITKVEVIVLETCTKAVDGVEAMEKESVGVEKRCREAGGLLASTEGVSCEITAGTLRGQTFELQRQGRLYEVHGDYYRGNADAISFTADVPNAAELSTMTVRVRKAPSAKHQLISRIRFHLANAEDNTGVPSPLKVKRTLDRAMLNAGVRFLTMSPVRELRDERGGMSEERGGKSVEIVNRSGRQVIKAKRVLDFRKPLPPAGEVEFSRIIVADGEPPASDRVKVERLGGEYPISHVSATGHVYRCTFKLPMPKSDYPSLAAAEWEARELTWTTGMMDDADQMTWGNLGVENRCRCRGVEDWGEYDVVVVGGGTAGAPAAIAAARAGAKTLLVEYCNVLGGTGTDGMILGYYDGNHCGFTEEFKQANVATKARFSLYPRAETWRRMCREAGVTVFLGAMGSGALVNDGKVEGVEIATPYGMGTVRARCVIDATGNSDVAASAGARTTFLSADEFALQSAGQAPHRIGRNGINSDFGFVNDSDVLDLWLFGLRARAGAPDAWDIAKMPDSRERRRIVPDYMVCAEDVAARRSFPDTVVQACSRQDSHGYLTDDFRFVSAPSAIQRPTRGRVKEMRWMFDVNVPMRSLLPKGLTSIAVVGLGAGCARDVLPMVRMQADLMNMGYAVGTAAAMAAPIGGDFRRIDYAGLRARLVDKGILRKETLDWNADIDVSSPELVADSVATMTDAFRGSEVVFRKENREMALPLLRDAYRKASTQEARQIYALMLGLMGDDTGVETLIGIVDGSLPLLKVRKPGGFGGVAQPMDGYLVALGRTRSPLAVAPLAKRLEMVGASASVNDIRGITLALEALGSPKVAERLAKFLEEGWFGGHSVSDISQLKPQGGYGLDDEMDGCIREMAFARALLASGDFQGKGREVYERYARDPRGVLSAHAKAVLEKVGVEGRCRCRGGDVQLRGKIGSLLESSLNHRVYSAHARGPVIEECENSFRTHWDDSVDENGKRRTGWQNEYWGKTMLCYAGAIRYTHDRALAEWCVAKAHYLIDTFQHEDGYLSTYGEQDFLRKDPENPDPNAHWCFNIWGQKYTMWALIELYRTTGDMKCLDAAEKMMDQLIAQMKRLGTTIDRTGSWAGLSSMTILRPLLELNRERPKPEYRALADHIVKVTDCDGEQKPIMNLIHDTFTDRPIVSWFDRPGFLAKAYEMQNFFEGVADYHRVTGDRRSLDAVVRFWEHLMREELNPMRSVGYFDHFLGSRSRVNGMSELCDITHFIRLGRELWKLTGRTQYLDAIEEAFYNAFLAGVSPEGDWGAHIVRSHGSRHLSAPPQTGMQLHQCCPDNMLRTFYDWAETVANVSADGAYEINFYSDADISLPGAKFEIRGGYPISESFRISATVGEQSRLRLRVPYWAKEITVNGEKVSQTKGRVELALAAGYSQLAVNLAMPVRMVKSEAPAVEDVVAVDRKVKLDTAFFMKWNMPEMKNPVRTTRAVQFMRGPIVLAKGRIAGTSREETLDFTSIDGQDGWKASLEPAKRTAVNAAAWGVWQLKLDDGQRQKQIPVADFWSVSNVDDPENWFSLWF